MLARTDHDFVLEEQRPRRAAKRTRRLAVLRTLFRNPGRTVVGASAAAVGVAIIVNALALQGGPHPAPFFKPAKEVKEQPAAPLPPARPANLAPAPAQPPAVDAERQAPATQPTPATQQTQVPASGVPATVPMPPRIQRQATAPAATAPAQQPASGVTQAPPIPPANIPNVARDPIADVLRGGSSSGGTTEIVRQEPTRQVLAAQRALNKLNYGPIKPDGLFGPGTRQAIERFEKDRKLPVTGEASGRTARELAAASGIPVD